MVGNGWQWLAMNLILAHALISHESCTQKLGNVQTFTVNAHTCILGN